MTRKNITYLLFFITIILFPLGIHYLKNVKVDTVKELNFFSQVEQSEIYLKTLIREKQHTTATIGTGLSQNENVINTLKDPTNSNLDLAGYSLHLRNTTDFKNVWFQLINKDGISLQRSWSDYKGDKISDARRDLQKLLKDPKPMKTISVGKFDMTFKSMIPVYENDKFLGIIEVITHFNSISKKLAQDNIKLVVLADERYKKQVTKPFTKKFVNDYYVANLDADVSLLNYLQNLNMKQLLSDVLSTKYIIDKDIEYLISYYHLKSIDDKPMGHFLLFHPLENFNTAKIEEIKDFYNLTMVLAIIVLVLLFYFTYSIKVEYKDRKHFDAKLLILITISFVVLGAVVYYFMNSKHQSDLLFYKESLEKQTILEYNSLINRNQDVSELIYSKQINSPEVLALFKERKREELYKYLFKSYKDLQINYNVRQLHFHLPDSTSFLRMHRPKKFGDSLKGIRESVDYVNQELKPFHGFEEGRIYNGFRHVYPVMDGKEHLGSVEISFGVYQLIDSYLSSFESIRVNFFISKSIIDKKVFEDEQSNYLKSPIEGFYFDKIVLQKLKSLGKEIVPSRKDSKLLEFISNNINKGVPFTVHFKSTGEIAIIIPLINKLTGKTVGSINVSKDDSFIQKREKEFNTLFIIILLIFAFITAFIYREILLKIKFNMEFSKNQTILDSQKSFIIVTDGKNTKASNRSMLEFFGFETLDQFLMHYDCICDKFEEVEGGYIKKQMSELNWFEYLKKNQEQENLVQILDLEGNPHTFYIEFNKENKIDDTEYIISFIDITRLKQMEQQLIHSEKMASLGTMIGNIAHQWRQPLSVVSTAASGVKMQSEYGMLEKDKLHQNMDAIVENANFLSETIETFTDFIKEGKNTQTQVIQNILDKTLKVLDASLKNNHIALINEIDYTTPINKDMALGELAQVVTNLINNAKDVLVERKISKPVITIRCKEENSLITISIEDNAGGVDEDIIDKVFEPYFTTKHQSVGTGLGLYMSHKIIQESLGGNLIVDNSDTGAVFTITLLKD